MFDPKLHSKSSLLCLKKGVLIDNEQSANTVRSTPRNCFIGTIIRISYVFVSKISLLFFSRSFCSYCRSHPKRSPSTPSVLWKEPSPLPCPASPSFQAACPRRRHPSTSTPWTTSSARDHGQLPSLTAEPSSSPPSRHGAARQRTSPQHSAPFLPVPKPTLRQIWAHTLQDHSHQQTELFSSRDTSTKFEARLLSLWCASVFYFI